MALGEPGKARPVGPLLALAQTLGIDFGTTASCVAVMEDKGDLRVIENLEGERTTASVVSITEDGVKTVGGAAKRQILSNAANTFWAVKRLLGRPFADPHIEELRSRVPFKIVAGANGEPYVEDEWGRQYSATEAAGWIIAQMRATAEAFTGQSFPKANLSIPSYFTDRQRLALREAAVRGGVEVGEMIPEPIAAAMGFNAHQGKDQLVAVFHLGGGTFDATVIELVGGTFQVRASAGDSFLGGLDFDARIADTLIQDFKKDTGIDLRSDTTAMQRVRDAAERVKTELSSSPQARVDLAFIAADATGPKHINRIINRSKLNSLVEDLLDKTVEPTMRALESAGVQMSEIGDVIATGGMTKMPFVRDAIQRLFGKEPIKGVNPDEAVALGCAMKTTEAAATTDESMGETDQLMMTDFLPLPINLTLPGGISHVLIEDGTPLPWRTRFQLSTSVDNQTSLDVTLTLGLRPLAEQNFALGTLSLAGLPFRPKGFLKFDLEIDINNFGRIQAVLRQTSPVDNIHKDWGMLNDETYANHSALAEASEPKDAKLKDKAEAQVLLSTALWELKKILHIYGERLGENDAKAVRAKLGTGEKLSKDAAATADSLKSLALELDSTRQGLQGTIRELYLAKNQGKAPLPQWI